MPKNASAKPKSKQPASSARKAAVLKEPRTFKEPKYRSFRLQKRIKPVESTQLPGSFRLFARSLKVLKRHWRLFAGIVLVYGILHLAFVRGFSLGDNLSTTKADLDGLFTGHFAHIVSGTALFIYLLGSTGSSSATAAASGYQFFLMLMVSLALIWAFRQVYAGHKPRIRDGFYKGMAPAVPFVLVLCVVGLQLIPLIIGFTLYGAVTSNGIAALLIERVLWAGVLFVLAVLSLYMMTSSVFALYVVTLPDMTPMKALRSARELVRHRRWTVLRKLVFLPFGLIVAGGLIVVPCILLAAPVAAWVFFLFSIAAVAIVHSYMYALYRALL